MMYTNLWRNLEVSEVWIFMYTSNSMSNGEVGLSEKYFTSGRAAFNHFFSVMDDSGWFWFEENVWICEFGSTWQRVQFIKLKERDDK
jgi:hypothetical protein